MEPFRSIAPTINAADPSGNDVIMMFPGIYDGPDVCGIDQRCCEPVETVSRVIDRPVTLRVSERGPARIAGIRRCNICRAQDTPCP
jgi:hypothetical protein